MATELNPADIQLAQKAVEKLKNGEQLTQKEGAAHQRLQRYQERQARNKLYRAVPQGDLAAMCGGEGGDQKQTKQLQDMERQWGLPFARETVNLFEFFPKLWEFLVRWGPLLRVVMEDADGSGDENSLGVRYLRAKIAKTEEDARAAANRNDTREGHLLDRDKVHAIFERLVSRLHRASDRAQAQWGADGYDFVEGLAQGFGEDIRGIVDAIVIESTDGDTDAKAETGIAVVGG